ncbi:MAG: hypothetical protein K2F91_00715 [Muribaculaceae bacterium]|nr:hypothetical protein [Muribaculaceae bacterium]
MKSFLIILSSLALLCVCLIQGCAGTGSDVSPLEQAEHAVANGRYAVAQELCDSMILGDRFGSMSVEELCRLSLVFMRLSENNTSGEEANTAFAARSLQAAIAADADSALLFLKNVPVEDQARAALITAISEAHNTPAISDTIYYAE